MGLLDRSHSPRAQEVPSLLFLYPGRCPSSITVLRKPPTGCQQTDVRWRPGRLVVSETGSGAGLPRPPVLLPLLLLLRPYILLFLTAGQRICPFPPPRLHPFGCLLALPVPGALGPCCKEAGRRLRPALRVRGAGFGGLPIPRQPRGQKEGQLPRVLRLPCP